MAAFCLKRAKTVYFRLHPDRNGSRLIEAAFFVTICNEAWVTSLRAKLLKNKREFEIVTCYGILHANLYIIRGGYITFYYLFLYIFRYNRYIEELEYIFQWFSM